MATGIGIELGPAAVRAVAVARSGGDLKLLAAREVSGECSSADTLTQALVQLRRALPITQPVILGIPSTSAILTTVSPLIVNTHRAVLAVQFELQQHLPFGVADAAWHYRWLSATNGQTMGGRVGIRGAGAGQAPPSHAPPQSSGAVVAAMRRTLLEERLACCRRAGLTVSAVALSPVALLNAWYAHPVSPRPSSVVLLNLVNERMVEWVVRTPSALEVVSVALETAQANEELAASWEALALHVNELPRSVWVMGSPDRFPGLQELITSRLGCEAHSFDLARAVASGANRLEAPGRWAAALGLALQALETVRLPLNLLASVQRQGRSRRVRHTAAITSGVFALAAIGFGISGMMEVRERRVLLLQLLERQEHLYQTLRPEVLTLLKRQQYIEGRSLQLEQLVGDRRLLTQLLAQIAEALPDDVWLTKVDCSKDGRIEGLLEGRAKSFQEVTQFLDRLKTVGGMTTVKPLSTTVTTDSGSGKEVIAFTVQVERQRVAAVPTPTDQEAVAAGALTPGAREAAGSDARRPGAKPAVRAKKPARKP